MTLPWMCTPKRRAYRKGSLMRFPISGLLLLLSVTACLAQSTAALPDEHCGEVVTIETHNRTTTRYAFVPPPRASTQGRPITLTLLAGGSGHVDLDEKGCARALKGNSLVRSIPLFGEAGFGTALVDAPSDYHGRDGLEGFRTAAEHAEDLGKVIADLRARTQGAVWLVGTSRGTISAVNAAARLSGPSAPDGVVLTSALMAGQSGAKKGWVAQTVFDLPLEAICLPLLVVGHAADTCIRSPASRMGEISARTNGAREQVVTVTGGPDRFGPPGIDACEGRSPHGFVDQEAEVADGIARFVRGGDYYEPSQK
jgi:hypothetical protein